jgi:hypothetical protein
MEDRIHRRFEMPNVGWNPGVPKNRGEGEKGPDRPDALGGVTSINFQEELLKEVKSSGGVGTLGVSGVVGSNVSIKSKWEEV